MSLDTIVLAPPGAEAAWCAAAARRLRFPDTAFLWPAGEATWTARFFSPAEGEMALCGQALLCADTVLRARGASGALTFLTASGPVRTSLRVGDKALTWLAFPRAQVRPGPEVAPLEAALGLEIPGPGRQQVVESGRRRVFRQVASPEALAALAPQPGQVLAYCRAHGLSGVCLYAPTGPGALALRVFTVSLEGAEDVSTGGAVLGLSWLLRGAGRPSWRILQGAGSFFRRGVLWLLDDPAADDCLVGGQVELVARGVLLPASP